MSAYSKLRLLLVAAVVASPAVALAQVDYSAGKTPEQLFAGDCAACHQAPQGLGRGRDVQSLTNFLREHYTTKTQWAALIANYLVRVRDLPPPPPPAPAAAPVQTGSAELPKNSELPAKPTVQTLQSKLRGYAAAGEKAVPVE